MNSDKHIIEDPHKIPTNEVSAAIAMALHLYTKETVHDYESYVITIKRKIRHEYI